MREFVLPQHGNPGTSKHSGQRQGNQELKMPHTETGLPEGKPIFRTISSRLAASVFALFLFVAGGLSSCAHCRAQAALLMEEPYGFFGALNPTGHNAIYFERICAETPVKLRRCGPGELGAVIARYQGMNGYDWLAIPLIPYLYSVEDTSEVPERVDHELVRHLRNKYHERHLLVLGEKVPSGNFFRGGWNELVGVAYERRIFAFRFETTTEQDDTLIERLNTERNHSHFHLLYNNCADFARVILNGYFPRTFRRSIFPDAGMTTPKQTVFKLVRYARKHPETRLTVFEIQQVPGYRRHSKSNKSIAESLVTTGYAVPIAIMNPYLAGGIFVDYVVRGRFHLLPKHPQILTASNLTELTARAPSYQYSESAGPQVPSAADAGITEPPVAPTAYSDLREIKDSHE